MSLLPHQIDPEYQFPHTRICHDCGEEIPCGLMNSINHYDICKRNAPNEDIFSHYRSVELKKRQEQEEREFNPIFQKMTLTEKLQLAAMSLGVQCGEYNLVGSAQLKRITDFKNEMKEKYK